MRAQSIIPSRLKHIVCACALAACAVSLPAIGAAKHRDSARATSKASAKSSPTPGAQSSLLEYTQVPRIYTQSPELFRSLLLEHHAAPTRIAHFGDSTSYDHLGAGGAHMNWRRWLWHQYHGHTPATQLSRSSNMGGVPGAEWIVTGGPIYAHPPVIPNEFLPPGYFGDAARTFSTQETPWAGMHIQLNHANDNHITQDCSSSPNGFYYVAPAIGQGTPAFAAGTMSGNRSLIDAAAGLRVEVLAARHPNSAPTVTWSSIPQTQFCNVQAFAPIVQSGQLFGGDESLNGPLGAAFRQTTPLLNPPAGNQMAFRVIVTGATAQASQGVQIIGARFISENPAGLVIDSFSKSSYTAASLASFHPNCGPILRAGGYSCAWLLYGLNDDFLHHPAAQFGSEIQSTIAFIRTAMNDPDFPVIVETCANSIFETVEGTQYAGVLYAIAQNDPRVMLVNSRRVTEERFGWGTGNEWQYLSDGVHYTNAGAEAMARSSIETILEYFDARPLPCVGDVTSSGAVDVDDLLAVVNAWGWTGAAGSSPADVIADGVVNIDDLLVVINAWGPC